VSCAFLSGDRIQAYEPRFQPNFAQWQTPASTHHGLPTGSKVCCLRLPCYNVSDIYSKYELLFRSGNAAKVEWWCLSASVCVSARISQKPHVRILLNLWCMLPAANMIRSSFGDAVTRCAVPVFWMTSCFSIMIRVMTSPDFYFRSRTGYGPLLSCKGCQGGCMQCIIASLLLLYCWSNIYSLWDDSLI